MTTYITKQHFLNFVVVIMLGAMLCGNRKVLASLTPVDIFNGNVGLSLDAVGSNSSPVGNIQAEIPVGSTILKAYLYSAGTPFPFFADSPRTTGDYNSAGINLSGNAITNFDTLVGASALPNRADIGNWFTGRADVTTVIQSLVAADSLNPTHSWEYGEGGPFTSVIDGGLLAIVFEEPGLPESSVVLLDGGQNTGGETTTVNFANPLTDPNDPEFFSDMSLGISFGFNRDGDQFSTVDINGERLTSSAGHFDDGQGADGALITVGGIGDTNANPGDPLSNAFGQDDELYNLNPFLNEGDTSFDIFSENPSDDDNIFFMGLHVSAEIGSVDPGPGPGPDPIPEPSTLSLLGLGVIALGVIARGQRRRKNPKA